MLKNPSTEEEVPQQGVGHPLQHQSNIVLSFLQKAELREIPACSCRLALILKGTRIQDGPRTNS